jgi:hypothetical protein
MKYTLKQIKEATHPEIVEKLKKKGLLMFVLRLLQASMEENNEYVSSIEEYKTINCEAYNIGYSIYRIITITTCWCTNCMYKSLNIKIDDINNDDALHHKMREIFHRMLNIMSKI